MSKSLITENCRLYSEGLYLEKDMCRVNVVTQEVVGHVVQPLVVDLG